MPEIGATTVLLVGALAAVGAAVGTWLGFSIPRISGAPSARSPASPVRPAVKRRPAPAPRSAVTVVAFAVVTAAAFAVIGWGACGGRYPVALLPALLYWAAVSVALTVIDVRHHRLPNVIVLPAYPVTAALLILASTPVGGLGSLWEAALGCLALFAFYWLLALAVPGGMGFGDVKLAGALGMLLGWFGLQTLLVGVVGAFVLGGLVGAVLLVTRRAGGTSRIPFGPFMLAGAWIAIALSVA